MRSWQRKKLVCLFCLFCWLSAVSWCLESSSPQSWQESWEAPDWPGLLLGEQREAMSLIDELLEQSKRQGLLLEEYAQLSKQLKQQVETLQSSVTELEKADAYLQNLTIEQENSLQNAQLARAILEIEVALLAGTTVYLLSENLLASLATTVGVWGVHRLVRTLFAP